MNILIINADQLRSDCVGYAGRRPVKTPNIDALARESVVYENAFTPLPVCAPARQSILSGRRPDAVGATWNYDFMPTPELDPAICWPGLLRDAGWNTGYIGHFHVSKTRSPADFGYTDSVRDSVYQEEVGYKYKDAPLPGGWLGCVSLCLLRTAAPTGRRARPVSFCADTRPRISRGTFGWTLPNPICRAAHPSPSRPCTGRRI